MGAALNPWKAAEASKPTAYQLGQYTIGALAYTMRDPVTGKDVHVSGKVWIENAEGEGMEADPGRIPEGATEEWMDRFWQENF